MTALFNNDLLRDLAEERVAIFVGAGVSASASIDGKPAFKGWPAFLHSAASTRDEPLKAQVLSLIEAKDYLLACQLLQDDYDDGWQDAVMSEYGKAAEPSSLHFSLMSLKQRIVITTNFDKLIETAWASSLKSGQRTFKVVSSVDNSVFRALKDYENPYLIKIHGSVDNAAGLVFSRSEYIRMAFGNKSYSSFLDSILLNYTVLFVGFSMDDPAISSLMEMYALKYPEARPHYLISPEGSPENIQELNKRLRKLSIIKYDPVDNHSQLPILINELSVQTNEKRRSLIADKLSSLSIDKTE